MLEVTETSRPRGLTIAALAKITLFALALAFFWSIRGVLLLFFIAFVLASVLDPAADWFERRRLGRTLGIGLIYAALIVLVVLAVRALVPLAVSEARDFIANADDIWSDILEWFGPFRDFVASHGLSADLNAVAADAFKGLGGSAGGLVTTARGLFEGVFSVIVVLVVAFWILVSERNVSEYIAEHAPEVHRHYLVDLFTRIEKSLGSWARGQLILSAIVGLAVYLMLTALGVRYALVLAVLAALGELAPYVGPLTAAVPGVLVALTVSPSAALAAGASYYAIHLIEANILVPKVMHKATGLHPVACIFALLVGLTLAGLVGALIAIPVATVIAVPLGDVLRALKKYRPHG